MPRKKQQRFNQNKLATNVIERGKEEYTKIKGSWNELYFRNDNPITLELACGKGEYTVGLGLHFPDRNFIGIDIKGDRIARGSKAASEAGLSNVAFLRTGIQFLDEFFEQDEVNEVWLVHPDPQPRDKEEKRRLSNQKFLNTYKKYLKKEGMFHLKTDSAFLYAYTMDVLRQDSDFEIIAHTDNLYKSPLRAEHFDIVTHYEQLFHSRGSSIHYIKSRLIKKAP